MANCKCVRFFMYMCVQNFSKELDALVVTREHNVALQQTNDALHKQLQEYSKQFQSITAAVAKSNQVCGVSML